MEIKRNVVALVERNQKKCGGLGGGNRNVVVVGGGGGGKTIEMWRAVYSFTIYEAVLKKVECGVDVGSI